LRTIPRSVAPEPQGLLITSGAEENSALLN
jgi:hypothetical protein